MPAIAAAAAPIAMEVLSGVATAVAGEALNRLKGKAEGNSGDPKANAEAGQMQPRAGLPGAGGAEGKPEGGGFMAKLKEGAQQLHSALDTGAPIKAALEQGAQKAQSAAQELPAMLGIRA